MTRIFIVLFVFLALNSSIAKAQMITGVWKGRIDRQKVELKIILRGDSLTGTSYYYESPTNYRRYSIRGYFDASSNEAVWWDDQLLEDRNPKAAPGRIPLMSRADFNCPGGGKMMLDGKSGRLDDQTLTSKLHFDKTEYGSFEDEWDFVIDNYLVGGNDPYIIDSVTALQGRHQPVATPSSEYPVAERPAAEPTKDIALAKPAKPGANRTVEAPPVVPNLAAAPTITQKFSERKKVFVVEIPLAGDSVELRFFDNAEIDGDSISLFLNDRLIFEHIRLSGSAYSIKLAVSELDATNELTMVAENLGAIPPNTSYMVAIVKDKRYEARLESTEGSSAMVRFVKH